MFASIFLSKFTSDSASVLLGGGSLEAAFPSGPGLWVYLGLGYLAIGTACCWRLARFGYPTATAVSGLACWPLLWSLMRQRQPPGDRGRNDRIDAAIAALRGTLEHAEFIPPGVSLDHLQLALHRVNARISWADRMLQECSETGASPELHQTLVTLRASRAHAAGELDAVLSSLVQLRIQLGLADLAEGKEPVAQCLGDLQARVDALRALSSMTEFEPPTPHS